jgi:hypothetical protein
MSQRIQPTSELKERTEYDMFRRFDRVWNMECSERVAMIALLEWLKPSCSIEIGTREGGSLSVISKNSGKVFTLDLAADCIAAASHFPNAEFIAGPSPETLPGVLRTIAEQQLALEFVLVDGDHSEEGVRRDIECILKYKPVKPCYILMHDSFNPFCREGIISAAWEKSPHVHSVDVDFITGKLHPPGETYNGMHVDAQMWGGFGLAVMRPEERVGPLKMLASSGYLYDHALRRSAHHRVLLAKHLLGTKGYQNIRRFLGERRFRQIGKLVVGSNAPRGWTNTPESTRN